MVENEHPDKGFVEPRRYNLDENPAKIEFEGDAVPTQEQAANALEAKAKTRSVLTPNQDWMRHQMRNRSK